MAYALTKREDLKLEVDESAGCDVCREVGLCVCLYIQSNLPGKFLDRNTISVLLIRVNYYQ